MFARTKRLTLRPGWPEDAAPLAQAIAHEGVVTKLSRVPWPYGEADARDFLSQPNDRDDFRLMITAHGDVTEPRLIGVVGLHREGDGHELGYWLTPDAWGRGYATEAARHVVAIARHALGLKRLTAGHFMDNPASGNVLRKLGFRPTGSGPQFSLARGREVECVRMELNLDETPHPMPIAA